MTGFRRSCQVSKVDPHSIAPITQRRKAMRRVISLSVVLTLVITSTGLSQDRRRPQQPQQNSFQQVFTLRGVEFTEDQQAQVEELRKKYTPQIAEIVRKHNSILSDEQRRARQEAFRAARQAGKPPRELKETVDAAVKMTDEQKETLAKLQKERADLFAKIQKELKALLTGEQQRQLRRQGQSQEPAQPPTHRDVKYGPYNRNVMDVWLAESDKPTPVLVSIHGGGFNAGNKSVSSILLRECLESGISVVAITYRFSNQAIAPAQFHDSARAIQFIRHNAKQWNLDPTRISATGGSAGAGISLWLGFHDDLADPDNEDPVRRESTRLACMTVNNGQTSYDPRFIRDLFPNANTYRHSAVARLFDVDMDNLDQLPKKKYRLFEECSPITHLTKDDPPAQLIYWTSMDATDIHSPRFGTVLKEKMDALGIRCDVYVGDEVLSGGEQVSAIDFVKEAFGMK
jgi:acetyl esterase/lipase